MNKLTLSIFTILFLGALACQGTGNLPAPSTPVVLENTMFVSGETAFGFFPTPPEVNLQSVFDHFKTMGENADFVLMQQEIPWEDFVYGVDGDSQSRTDLRNQIILAQQNGLGAVFVVDPLNGLNRREFMGLPAGWEANFANQDIRKAITNFALWITREFHPRFLGLASEINTYADAFPNDFPNFLSLYREIYTLVKTESPETQIFVTFQWEDLNNLFAAASEGRQPYATNWEQVEAFEPQLDVWAVSSYPFFIFQTGADIPKDYYTPLLSRTDKPLAFAEGGYTSQPVGLLAGTPEDQAAYLNAIHDQLGGRLSFWVYLLLTDLNVESYADWFRSQGLENDDLDTLGFFASVGLQEADGTPKPALAIWNQFRATK